MQHFIPSDEIPPLAILSNALTSVPPSVARAAIEEYTQPGDVILDPFCVGVGIIQAALDLDRKIIAASFNPIAILAIEATLWPIDPRAACSEKVLFPDFNQNALLPEGEQVTMEFTPEQAGEYSFQCQLGMLRGKLIVK